MGHINFAGGVWRGKQRAELRRRRHKEGSEPFEAQIVARRAAVEDFRRQVGAGVPQIVC